MKSKAMPRSIGIIMDGNRRYARERGLSPLVGHEVGYQKLKEVISWAQEGGIQYLTVFAFSTENWKRAPEEVGALMDLFRLLARELQAEKDTTLRVRFVGEKNAFPTDIKEAMERIETQTEGHGPMTLVVAASYGGRQEILTAAATLARAGGEVTEERFGAALMTKDIPDPDLIIRTSGEHRLSNFLLWQSAYSELFFISTHWPAFTREEFDGVLREYADRERRFGV